MSTIKTLTAVERLLPMVPQSERRIGSPDIQALCRDLPSFDLV